MHERAIDAAQRCRVRGRTNANAAKATAAQIKFIVSSIIERSQPRRSDPKVNGTAVAIAGSPADRRGCRCSR